MLLEFRCILLLGQMIREIWADLNLGVYTSFGPILIKS